jgi:hydrogenase maturation protein HypF
VTEADGPVETVALRFHRTVVAATLAMVDECARATDVRTVCLGGGVFQNALLTGELVAGLGDLDLTVYMGQSVPVNDGGISYGQAAVAAARMNGE